MTRLLLLALLVAGGCTAPPAGVPSPPDATDAALPDGVTLVAAVTVERSAPHTDLAASPPPPDGLVRTWAGVDAVYRGSAEAEVSFLILGPALEPGTQVVVFLAPTGARVPWRSMAPPAPFSAALDAALR